MFASSLCAAGRWSRPARRRSPWRFCGSYPRAGGCPRRAYGSPFCPRPARRAPRLQAPCRPRRPLVNTSESHAHAALCTVRADESDLLLGIGRERINGHNHRHAELLHVVECASRLQTPRSSAAESGAFSSALDTPPLYLSAHGRYEDDAVGREASLAALDVHEFFPRQGPRRSRPR